MEERGHANTERNWIKSSARVVGCNLHYFHKCCKPRLAQSGNIATGWVIIVCVIITSRGECCMRAVCNDLVPYGCSSEVAGMPPEMQKCSGSDWGGSEDKALQRLQEGKVLQHGNSKSCVVGRGTQHSCAQCVASSNDNVLTWRHPSHNCLQWYNPTRCVTISHQKIVELYFFRFRKLMRS